MRFALLGGHVDGIDFAQALAASGRHEIAVYSGPAEGLEALQRRGLRPSSVGDVEEILADPRIDAVIVAGGPATRAGQLRRALQSERHVVCVHPADPSPDLAYEAALLQTDTGCVLLPALVEALHPGIARLAALARPQAGDRSEVRVVEVERWATEELLFDEEPEVPRPGLPGWDVLRRIGGEVAEVFALTPTEELAPAEPILLTGRFVGGCLFQASLLPTQAAVRYEIRLTAAARSARLTFPAGWPGPAALDYVDDQGVPQCEEWGAFNPWSALVEAFETAVAGRGRRPLQPGQLAPETLAGPEARLGWQDEVRCLELDAAARRSIERGRSSTLDLAEATEEASFKGTMTLVGCGLLWLSLVLLILSAWFHWLGWVIGPVFAVFLILQIFRWVLPAQPDKPLEPQRTQSTPREDKLD